MVMENAMSNARLLSKALEATGWYTCVSDIHRKKGEFAFKSIKEQVFGNENETSADYNAGLPVVAFRFSDEFKKEFPLLKQSSIATLLRAKQYIIPSMFACYKFVTREVLLTQVRLSIAAKRRKDRNSPSCSAPKHVAGLARSSNYRYHRDHTDDN